MNKFNSSSMGINEIVKKKNLPLITNDTIKNLIIKFRNEREKEMNEKRVFYRESSYQDIQREKNTQFLMLRAMLRRDPLTIQSLMNRNKRKQTKIKKSVSMKYLIRDKINYDKKKFFNKTTDDTIASEKYQNNNSSNNQIGLFARINNTDVKNISVLGDIYLINYASPLASSNLASNLSAKASPLTS